MIHYPPAVGTPLVGSDANALVITGGSSAFTDITGTSSQILMGGAPPGFVSTGWTAYTPTLTLGSGSLTTFTSNGRYLQLGKLFFINININITTNGTGGTTLKASMPAAYGTAPATQILVGREDASTGAIYQGKINSGDNGVFIFTSANGYPGHDGYDLIVQGVVEST